MARPPMNRPAVAHREEGGETFTRPHAVPPTVVPLEAGARRVGVPAPPVEAGALTAAGGGRVCFAVIAAMARPVVPTARLAVLLVDGTAQPAVRPARGADSDPFLHERVARHS